MKDSNQVPETVRVKSPVSDDNPLGYVVINKDDLTDEQTLFDEAEKEVEAEVKSETPAIAPSWQQK